MPFTLEDLAVLRLLPGTAALAIDQTSLLQRTQSRSGALDYPLDRRVGAALRPPSIGLAR